MTRRVSAPHLVDRAEERALLAAAWVEAAAGTSRTVLVTGEAGIGKTRLLEVLADDLARSDGLVLRGACVPLGGHSPPYAPLRAVLSDLAAEVGAEALPGMAGGAALSRILPALAEPPLPAGAAGGMDDLADVVARVLHAASAQRPVAVLVEDLHWADSASRDLVGYLARVLRTSRLLLVASLRTTPAPERAVQEMVDEMVRLPGVERMELKRLGEAGVLRQMTGILGAPPDAAFAGRVVERSQGVPFLVEELTAAGRAGDEALPPELRDVLLHSTRPLSSAATGVLRAAAAAGGPVDEDSLAAVSRVEPEHLRPALRELVEHQLLVVDRREARYDFRHALLREAVEDDLLPGEAATLHERYAVLAEEQPSGDHAVAVAAHHWWQARNAARAYPALLAASEVARSMSAYGEELLLLQRARALRPELGDVATAEMPDDAALLTATGRAARLAGRYELARDLLSGARQRLAASAGHLRLAEVLWEESLLLRSLGAVPGAETAVQALLDDLPRTPSRARAHALNALLQFQLHRRETQQAQVTLHDAVRTAQAAGEPAVAAHLRVTAAGLLLDEGAGPDEVRALLTDSWLAAEQLDDVPLMLRVLDMRARLHIAHGDFQEGERDARNGLRLCAERGSPVLILDYLVGDLCDALIATGSWSEVLRVLGDALAVDRPNLERAGLHARLATVRAAGGDSTGAREALTAAHRRLSGGRADPGLVVVVATAEAEVSLWEGRLSAAVETAREAYVGLGAQVGPHLLWPLLRAAAAATTAVPSRGRALPSAWLEGAVAAQKHRDATSCWPHVLQAFLSDGHVGLWDAALSATASDDVPVLVRLQVLLAAASAHATAGDRDRAAGLLADVVSGAREIGARPLLDATEMLAERARLRVPGLDPDRSAAPPPPNSFGLTAREIEVLALLADGSSNRQIAAELVISTKTVSVHVSHILTKLGVASRGEAAATARARGLVGKSLS